MTKNLRAGVALLCFRVIFASILLEFHGYARFFRAWNYVVHGTPWTFVAVVQRLGFPAAGFFAVMSALSESIGGLLVGLGLYTRWAALIFAGNMAVAFYNEAIQWNSGGTPETPLLYLLGALAIAYVGGGPWSLERVLRHRSIN